MCQPASRISVGTLYRYLQRCVLDKDLAACRNLLSLVYKTGFEENGFLAAHLIRMFAVCGSLEEADWAFGRVLRPTVFTWTAIILAHAKSGAGEQALHLYRLMCRTDTMPDRYIFFVVMKICSCTACLNQGILIHQQVVESCFQSDVLIANTIIDMYLKCGSLEDACGVFCKMLEQDVATWSLMIAGFVERGHNQVALGLSEQMKQEGIVMNHFTFLGILKACTSTRRLHQIHVHVLECGLQSDEHIGSSLISMYAKCRSMPEVQKVFDRLSSVSIVVWNSFLSAYIQDQNFVAAYIFYRKMQHKGIEPDDITFVCALKACSWITALGQGKLIHLHIVECGLESNPLVQSSLVDMYFKCGSFEDADMLCCRISRKDVVLWSTMIAGYVQHGFFQKAIDLFQQMQQDGKELDNAAFVSILKACSCSGALNLGKKIHAHIISLGSELHVYVGNMLTDMYAKSGSLQDARNVFENLGKPDLVTWNVIIAGYAEQGKAGEALQLFQKMQAYGLDPNNNTFASVTRVCSSLSALDCCALTRVANSVMETDGLRAMLIGMYVKCGNLEDASKVLHKEKSQDVALWTAVIGGYARQSNHDSAFRTFQDMQRQDIKPNSITFVSLLAACSHVGLVDRGCNYFKMMCEDHGLVPTLEHYNCMVDLFARSGCLDEAEDLLQSMPFHSNFMGWRSLLSHCRSHKNLELAAQSFNNVVCGDTGHASGYVLMATTYVNTGSLENAVNVQELRQHAHAWKKPGKALIEVDNLVHVLTVKDVRHPHRDQIHEKLDLLNNQIKVQGYVPEIWVLQTEAMFS